MSDISGVNGSSNILEQFSAANKTTNDSSDLGQAEFFELMVAQMKNQDPLKPELNGDFIAQLAQFKTSDGIANMESSLDSLTSSMQSNQALQASSLVGRSVLVSGSTANLAAGGHVEGSASLPGSARNVMLDIHSSTGALVKQVPLGTQPSGDIKFQWDGTGQDNKALPAGQYNVSVSGNVGGETMQFSTHIAANVNSVNLGSNGGEMKLNIEGVGQRTLSQVKQIGS